MKYQLVKSEDLPGGGKVVVIIKSDERIRAEDHFILRPDAMQEMSAVLASLADSMQPDERAICQSKRKSQSRTPKRKR